MSFYKLEQLPRDLSTISIQRSFRSRVSILFFAVLFFTNITLTLSNASASTDSELVVIVNTDTLVDSISASALRKLFLGKSRKLPNGARAVLAGHSKSTTHFNQQALRRSDSAVIAAWSRLKFSGRSKPPRDFDDLDALVDFVINTPNSIAYLPAGVSLVGVKTIRAIP